MPELPDHLWLAASQTTICAMCGGGKYKNQVLCTVCFDRNIGGSNVWPEEVIAKLALLLRSEGIV